MIYAEFCTLNVFEFISETKITIVVCKLILSTLKQSAVHFVNILSCHIPWERFIFH